MPIAFTEEEMTKLRHELILAGIRLSRELGLQRMSVEKITSAVGIAKGSFYIFFDSKEDFILEIADYANRETEKMLFSALNGRRQMSAHEFISFLIRISTPIMTLWAVLRSMTFSGCKST